MKQREFEIVIGPDGTVELQVRGFKGPGCVEAAKWLGQVVGEVESQQLTSEYYDPEEQVRHHIDRRH